MKIAIPKERIASERRVAATPETVQKMVKHGGEVWVEKGAGADAYFTDAAYEKAGAHIAATPTALYKDSDLILKVQPPTSEELELIPSEKTIIGLLGDAAASLTAHKLHGYDIIRLPRISRAQTMDALSSQSTIAGYWSVLKGAELLPSLFPMLMTAAGTIAPAKVLVLGAGVAGLQAIASAKRLGANVYAFDVRPEVKEQVESLGGNFVDIPLPEGEGTGEGGYAKGLGKEAQARQRQAISELLPTVDLVITTALIPGKPAPQLITKDMLDQLRPGSVVIDLAAEMGGNCAGSKPGEHTDHKGVQIFGAANAPSTYPRDASALYARNLWHFLEVLWDKGTSTLKSSDTDELLEATYLSTQAPPAHAYNSAD